jgi:hypothetical protein
MTTYTTSDDGGVTSRPMNEIETNEHKLFLANVLQERTRKAKAEADKAIARQAVLDRLGITSDEAALLLS